MLHNRALFTSVEREYVTSFVGVQLTGLIELTP